MYATFKSLGNTEQSSQKQQSNTQQNKANIGSSHVPNKSMSDSRIINITSQEHKEDLIKNNMLCIVYIYGNFCNPCKIVAPKFSELSTKYQIPRVVFTKEDSDLNLTPVGAVPCFMFYKAGKLITDATIMGGNIRQVEDNIQKLLK